MGGGRGRNQVGWGCLPLLVGGALGAQAPTDPMPYANQYMSETRTTLTIQGVGARSMGLGNAFTAMADDATAVSYNPAGLAQLIEPEATFVGYHARRFFQNTDYRAIAGGRPLVIEQDPTTHETTQPLFVAYTLPLRIWGRNVVLQASHHRLFDMAYRAETQLRVRDLQGNIIQQGLQSIDQDGRMNVASLAIAADLTPRLLAGFALNRWRGQWTMQGERSFLPGPESSQQSLQISQSNDFRGTQWSLGLIWRSETLQLGYTFRASFLAGYTFGYSVLAQAEGQPPESDTGSASVGLRWPCTTALGLAWRPHPQWMLAADWTRTDWSQTRFESDHSSLAGRNFFDLQYHSRIPSARTLHLGSEFLALNTPGVLVPLRVGWFREPLPDVDAISGAQRIRHGWSAGLGIRRGRANLDIAWTAARSDRSVTEGVANGNTEVAAFGQEKMRERRLYVSLSVRFDRDETNQFLQWLLVGR